MEISSDGGIVVSIAAFQAVDPGSIPGHRSRYAYFYSYSLPSPISTYLYTGARMNDVLLVVRCSVVKAMCCIVLTAEVL